MRGFDKFTVFCKVLDGARFAWLVVDANLLREKITNGWLVVSALVCEKSADG